MSLNHAARTCSRFLHPVVIIAVSTIIFTSAARQNLWYALIDSCILVGSLMPSLGYHLWRKRQGDQSSQHLIPLLLALSGLGMAALFLWMLHAPRIELYSLLIGFIFGAGATLINRVWNISFHAAIPMSCAALIALVSWPMALVIAGLAVIVGLARLPIEQHSLVQVLAGWVYGFGITTLAAALLVNM